MRLGNRHKTVTSPDWRVTINGSQLHEIMVETMVDELLQCLEGTSVSATKPLFWYGRAQVEVEDNWAIRPDCQRGGRAYNRHPGLHQSAPLRLASC